MKRSHVALIAGVATLSVTLVAALVRSMNSLPRLTAEAINRGENRK
jgi:hypothetical protein